MLNIESSPDGPKVKPVVTVEPDGRIALGLLYGRAQVGGKSLTEAEQIVQEIVAKVAKGPEVQITFGKRAGN